MRLNKVEACTDPRNVAMDSSPSILDTEMLKGVNFISTPEHVPGPLAPRLQSTAGYLAKRAFLAVSGKIVSFSVFSTGRVVMK